MTTHAFNAGTVMDERYTRVAIWLHWVIGLAVITRMNNRHVFFRCGDRAVFLVFNPLQTIQPDPNLGVGPHGARGPGHVAFAARESELQAWRQRLAACGVEIEREIQWPAGGRSNGLRCAATTPATCRTRRRTVRDRPRPRAARFAAGAGPGLG